MGIGIPLVKNTSLLFDTLVGMMSQRAGKIIMPSDHEKQPCLPQHDFADPHLFTTPSAHRFFNKEGTGVFVDGMYTLKNVDWYGVIKYLDIC